MDFSDSSGSGVGDVLNSIISAAQTGYTDYSLSSAGIIPTSNPGQYVIQPGSRAQIVQPAQQNTQMTIIWVVILLLIGLFAYKAVE